MEVEKVGDSSTNRLANYQRCARELLRSALLEQPSIARQRAPTPTELRRWALIKVYFGRIFKLYFFIGGRRNC